MKKPIFSVPVYIVILYLVVSLISCNKENPITPPPSPTGYQFDSARYDWKIDTLLGYGYSTGGYFVLDSSNYYMVSDYGQFIHHDEHGFHKYPLPEQYVTPVCVFGKEKNNIFIGGFKDILGTNLRILKLINFNGSLLKDIPLNSDSISKYMISSIYVRNNSEIWLGTYVGKIIKFDGINLTYYSFNPNQIFSMYANFFEQDNQLYSVGYTYDEFYWVDSVFFYKYTNSQWEMVYNRGYSEPHIFFTNYSIIDGTLYSIEQDGIYKFTGDNFVKFFNIEQSIFGPTEYHSLFAGATENNILIQNSTDSQYYSGFYNWNGKKWSCELKYFHNPFYANICVDGHYFLFTGSYYNAYFYRGKPKLTIENK
jgi:hypothetical protein